jgi:hypothetical protein
MSQLRDPHPVKILKVESGIPERDRVESKPGSLMRLAYRPIAGYEVLV